MLVQGEARLNVSIFTKIRPKWALDLSRILWWHKGVIIKNKDSLEVFCQLPLIPVLPYSWQGYWGYRPDKKMPSYTCLLKWSCWHVVYVNDTKGVLFLFSSFYNVKSPVRHICSFVGICLYVSWSNMFTPLQYYIEEKQTIPFDILVI